MSTQPMPGDAVPLPLPPEACEVFGYRGSARYVMLSFAPLSDEIDVADGLRSGTGDAWAFQAYRRHRAVTPLLDGLDNDRCLMIDRGGCRASLAPHAEARAFIVSQHPPAPPLSPEAAALVMQAVEAVNAEGWREEPVDMGRVLREMAASRARLKRFMSWLDQCPDAGQGR